MRQMKNNIKILLPHYKPHYNNNNTLNLRLLLNINYLHLIQVFYGIKDSGTFKILIYNLKWIKNLFIF